MSERQLDHTVLGRLGAAPDTPYRLIDRVIPAKLERFEIRHIHKEMLLKLKIALPDQIGQNDIIFVIVSHVPPRQDMITIIIPLTYRHVHGVSSIRIGPSVTRPIPYSTAVVPPPIRPSRDSTHPITKLASISSSRNQSTELGTEITRVAVSIEHPLDSKYSDTALIRARVSSKLIPIVA
jgi:hypothetical protein